MKPRKVLIVGAGTAGWMTAAYLQSAFKRNGLDATTIEIVDADGADDDRGAVATLPEFNRFLAIVGLDQLGFMRKASATFRQGTRFVDWLRGKGEHYFHPFDMERPGSIDRAAERWLRSNRSLPFADTVSLQPALCRMELAPMMLSRWDFGPPLSFGFHADTAGLCRCLESAALAGGVVHRRARAVAAELTGDGGVAAVLTADGQRVDADLFIDCSGRQALLFDALQIEWVEPADVLQCDRRLSLRVPYERHFDGRVPPYTCVTAGSAGWIEDVPLQDRRELASVFSRAWLDDEAALAELRAYGGPHAGSLDAAVDDLFNRHRKRAWAGNCIAIGRAAGEIESLEGTDLYFIEHAVTMLAEHFPLGDEFEPLAFRYNRIMTNRFYELLDFVNLHYCLTRRDDSEFWREARRDERITDRLKTKLEYWRLKQPTPSDFQDQAFPGHRGPLPGAPHGSGSDRIPVDTAALWNHENYEAVLYGMGFLESECDEWFGNERPESEVPAHIARRLALAPEKLPPHAVWLQRVAGMPTYPSR